MKRQMRCYILRLSNWRSVEQNVFHKFAEMLSFVGLELLRFLRYRPELFFKVRNRKRRRLRFLVKKFAEVLLNRLHLILPLLVVSNGTRYRNSL
jgi:hypothetical protein